MRKEIHCFSVVLAALYIIAGGNCGATGQMKTGLDVLIDEGFARLAGKSIGILTHQSAVDRMGRHLLETLPNPMPFKIGALFAPEHGFYGSLDREGIEHSYDNKSGLKIYSLYGDHKAPTGEMLEGIDCLVIDLQDIGTRFYTYQTTLLKTLEACSTHGVAVLILDRPNPIGGLKVAGPVLEQSAFSFTGSFSMPIIHGMTMGELAQMFCAERSLNLKMEIVRLSGWVRSQLFEDTGLVWVDPSPNMRKPLQAKLYPAIGLLEFTNISVGRGTDSPFERLGAPWVKPAEFAGVLNGKGLPGVRFTPHFFTPVKGPYEGILCGGVFVHLDDWHKFDPFWVAIALSQTLRELYPADYHAEKLARLLGNSVVMDAFLKELPLPAIKALFQPGLNEFLRVRQSYLLY